MTVLWDQDTKDILEAFNFIKDKVEQSPDRRTTLRRQIVEEVVDEKLRLIHSSLSRINRPARYVSKRGTTVT